MRGVLSAQAGIRSCFGWSCCPASLLRRCQRCHESEVLLVVDLTHKDDGRFYELPPEYLQEELQSFS